MRERERFLVFGEPVIGEEEIAAVVATMRSRWLGTGPRVKEFQERFAAYVCAKHAVATNSCTAALHLAMAASGIGPGDEVITSPMTFCATANAILHCGARPVFVDCDPGTGNLRPELVEAAVTPRTRAILPVHLAGLPCDMPAIMDIAARRGLEVIEDCAHAIEAQVAGRHCGTWGRAGCFSFYVTKNLTTVEGGMVVTDDEEFAARVRVLSLHGMSKDAWKRFSDSGYVHYEVAECGYKYNMTDMQAALGLCQLARVDEFLQRRTELWRRYQVGLAGLPLLLPPDPPPGADHARHLFAPRLDLDRAALTRDELLAALQRRKIGAGVHYLALHHHLLYQRLGYRWGDFPGAEFVSDRTFSLPLSPAVSDADADDVIAALHDSLAGAA
ncbi:MAG: DegT/DnrJ/EryC1/StrS family aminotransferase [Limisphaerales bacterium]